VEGPQMQASKLFVAAFKRLWGVEQAVALRQG
jgi:hypothetical protein